MLGLSCRSDVVEIETWCHSEGRIGTRRDWIIKDYASGQLIGRATRCVLSFSFCAPFICITKCKNL